MTADAERAAKDQAYELYERAERQYLEALAARRPHDELTAAADEVFRAAFRWHEAEGDYSAALLAAGYPQEDVSWDPSSYGDTAELLTGLWGDVVMAHMGQLPPHSDIPPEYEADEGERSPPTLNGRGGHFLVAPEAGKRGGLAFRFGPFQSGPNRVIHQWTWARSASICGVNLAQVLGRHGSPGGCDETTSVPA